jgi:glutathione-regulated potassium-efflux system ancillary protein KefC
MSSTAIGLGVLAERNLMATSAGGAVLAVMLLQDIAAIPILAGVPLLAPTAADAGAGSSGWIAAAKALAVIAAIVFGGRLLLRPTLRWIARSDTPEIFTAAALLLVVATAALMQSVGLSMALGAFLAGVLLAESEYRRELETDLEPFKGLLLGLFFIAVGMSIDFAVVLASPGLVAGIVFGFLVVKALVLVGMARAMGLPLQERPVFVVLLAQGGEFGFVVLQQAAGAGVIGAGPSTLLVAAIALSMALTPLLLLGVDRLLAPRLAKAQRSSHAAPRMSEERDAPIIICGFGRYGQIVGRLLSANGLKATVLDHNAEQVAGVRRFGWEAFYGDATRLDLLRTAGAAKAKVIVVAVDEMDQSLAIVDLAKEHFRHALLVVRARNAEHWYRLHERGVRHIERETLDSALLSGRSVLEAMGFTPHAARTSAWRFRRHSVELLQQLAPLQGDENQLIAASRQGRDQLEQVWAREREERHAQALASGWHPPEDTAKAPPETPR